MIRVGHKEAEAVRRVILSGRLFRYQEPSECRRFEERFARYVGVPHAILTSSGTTALQAALVGVGIGPGCEVIVPAYTFMATAVAVVAVGAIPVIVDIDESLTLGPEALEDALGPRTRAVIPVHMCGLPCDMEAILRVARRRRLIVVEDACQAVGGGYRGRKLGSFGEAAAFSFNYYKNMTCGEGGAVVVRRRSAAERARCVVDCGSYFWTGRGEIGRPFVSAGARASELEGAMLNAQLDGLDGWLRVLRRQKKRILRGVAGTPLSPAPAHSLEDECATQVAFRFPTAEQAEAWAKLTGGWIPLHTGRHVYTNWDPILEHRGAHDPRLDPFRLPANRRCRKRYTPDMCQRSLEILGRTVLIPTWVDRSPQDVDALIARLRAAAREVLASSGSSAGKAG